MIWARGCGVQGLRAKIKAGCSDFKWLNSEGIGSTSDLQWNVFTPLLEARDRLGILLVYLPPCCTADSLTQPAKMVSGQY